MSGYFNMHIKICRKICRSSIDRYLVLHYNDHKGKFEGGGEPMTIVEAIKAVLENNVDGMTAAEIYNKIISKDLYSFGAKSPVSVVNVEIRRRCRGLDFPTAYPVKLFEIVGFQGKKPLYILKLIDGKLLSELLVKYQVGLSTVQSISIYRVDSDYYGE